MTGAEDAASWFVDRSRDEPPDLALFGCFVVRLPVAADGATAWHDLGRHSMDHHDRDVTFPECNIYYNYAFDLGDFVNPVDVARRLLEADIGLTFRNYATGDDEICEGMGPFVNGYRKLVDVHEILGAIPTKGAIWALVRLLRLDFRVVGRELLRTAGRVLFARRSVEGHDENDDGPEEGLRETIQEAQSILAELVGERAIHEHVDRTVFHEDYLDQTPFTRVDLPPFSVAVRGEVLDLSPTAMIHRSGVCVLTTRCPISKPTGIDEIISLERATMLPIEGAVLPGVIYHRYARLLYGATGKRETEVFDAAHAAKDRPGYVDVEQAPESVVLASILDGYRYSIIEVAHGRRYRGVQDLDRRLRSSAWFGYPVVFVTLPDVARGAGEGFAAANRGELARMIIGYGGGSEVRPKKAEEILADDLSLTDRYSLYLTEGSATVLNWGDVAEGVPPEAAPNEGLRQQFLTTVVIDMLVVQRMILAIFMEKLKLITSDRAGLLRLKALKQELLVDLDEFEALGLSHYGSVTDILKRGREILRLNEIYGLFTRKLAIMEAIAQAEDVSAKAAREGVVKGVTTIVATLLSLTTANALVKVLLGWSSAPSAACPPWVRPIYALVVGSIQARPVFYTVAIYLASLLVTVLVLWARSPKAMLRERSMVPTARAVRSRPGVVSPMPFSVRPVEAGSGNGVNEAPGGRDETGAGASA